MMCSCVYMYIYVYTYKYINVCILCGPVKLIHKINHHNGLQQHQQKHNMRQLKKKKNKTPNCREIKQSKELVPNVIQMPGYQTGYFKLLINISKTVRKQWTTCKIRQNIHQR